MCTAPSRRPVTSARRTQNEYERRALDAPQTCQQRCRCRSAAREPYRAPICREPVGPLMETIPDGFEVVASHADAARLGLPPLLIVDAVAEFLDSHGLGAGPLSWSRIGDGASNVTYRIRRGRDVFILRRGPRPPLPKSTHDMVREARIQQLLKKQGVPVPEILAVCEEASVLGVPFYIMSFLNGIIITRAIPAYLGSVQQREATSAAVLDALVQLACSWFRGNNLIGEYFDEATR